MLVMMNGFVNWDFDWIRLRYMDRNGFFNFNWHVFLYWVRYMLDHWIRDELLERNGDFGFNWNSYWLIYWHFNRVRLRYTDQDWLGYIDLQWLVNRDSNVLVKGHLYWALYIGVFSNCVSLGMSTIKSTVSTFKSAVSTFKSTVSTVESTISAIRSAETVAGVFEATMTAALF